MVFTPSRPSSSSEDFRDLLEASYHNSNLVHLGPGSSVPLLKNSIWLVVRGMVKLSAISVHGDEVMVGLVGPGEPFGDPLSQVEAYEALTLAETDLLCLSCEVIARDQVLSVGLLKSMAQRYRQSEALLALLGLRRIEDRVRGFLEMLATSYGQPCDQGLRLPIKLTHQDIASALSTTRVTVTRILGSLRDEGWLSIDAGRSLVVGFLPSRKER